MVPNECANTADARQPKPRPVTRAVTRYVTLLYYRQK